MVVYLTSISLFSLQTYPVLKSIVPMSIQMDNNNIYMIKKIRKRTVTYLLDVRWFLDTMSLLSYGFKRYFYLVVFIIWVLSIYTKSL